MGEAGGGLLGNLPAKSLHGGAGETSPPAFAAPYLIILPDQSSFSVFRGTPMAFSCDHFKKLKCNIRSDFPCNLIPQHALFDSAALHKEIQRLGIPIEVLDLPVGHVSITPVDLDGVTGDLKGRL